MKEEIKDIAIFGAGGLGRETQWLINRINQKNNTYNILGFFDDTKEKGDIINGDYVIGNLDELSKFDKKINVVIAIANAKARKEIALKLMKNPLIAFPNLIDPTVLCSDFVTFGRGNLIFANSILTINIILKDFNIISFGCSVGHDDVFNSYITLYPSVNVSGNVIIKDCCELGTGTKVIQKKQIGENTILGAGSIVIKNIKGNCTAVGVPTHVIKNLE